MFKNELIELDLLEIGKWTTPGRTEILFKQGKYQVDVYGAQGGHGNYYPSKRGGHGGHMGGIVDVLKEVRAYVYVGGKGTTGGDGGFNGGGKVPLGGISGSGGGASDLRVISDDLYHRIIVAGGGGGSEYDSLGDPVDSAGGGLEGGCGHGDDYNDKCGAIGGSQNLGGSGYEQGNFGYGGNVSSVSNGGGGGGGWYGGGSGNYENDGAGGSGYVLTQNSFKPQGYFEEWGRFLFNNITMESGVRGGDGMVVIKRVGEVGEVEVVDDKCSFMIPWTLRGITIHMYLLVFSPK